MPLAGVQPLRLEYLHHAPNGYFGPTHACRSNTKAYDGLAVLVRQSLGADPLNGSLYVFCNRRRDRIKILFWEEGGYWLCARRLERGTFRWPQKEGSCANYRREELLLLLGGIDLKQTQERKWYRREAQK